MQGHGSISLPRDRPSGVQSLNSLSSLFGLVLLYYSLTYIYSCIHIQYTIWTIEFMNPEGLHLLTLEGNTKAVPYSSLSSGTFIEEDGLVEMAGVE